MTEEDAESGRRGDAESRLCRAFDANGFKPPTRVVEKKKDIPCWNPLALDMGCKSVRVSSSTNHLLTATTINSQTF